MGIFHVRYENVLLARDGRMEGLRLGPEGGGAALAALSTEDNPGGRFSFAGLTVGACAGCGAADEDGDWKLSVSVTLAVRARGPADAGRMAVPGDYLDEAVAAVLPDGHEYDIETAWDRVEIAEAELAEGRPA